MCSKGKIDCIIYYYDSNVFNLAIYRYRTHEGEEKKKLFDMRYQFVHIDYINYHSQFLHTIFYYTYFYTSQN